MKFLLRSTRFSETSRAVGIERFLRIMVEFCSEVPGFDTYKQSKNIGTFEDARFVNIGIVNQHWRNLYDLVKKYKGLTELSPVEDYLEAIDLVDFQIYLILGDSYANYTRSLCRQKLPREIESFIKLNDSAIEQRRRDSAIKIQKAWLLCRWDPKYEMCWRVQAKNLERDTGVPKDFFFASTKKY